MTNYRLIALPWFAIAFSLFFTPAAHGSKCGDFVYNKHGMWRKYEYINLTITEVTKKHGTSTSSNASTETSTAVTDPGVYTGAVIGLGQVSSSWGECGSFFSDIFNLFANRQEYKQYIAQNAPQIKTELAYGDGGHLRIIAAAHHCDTVVFGSTSQKRISDFAELNGDKADQFIDALNATALAACPTSKTKIF